MRWVCRVAERLTIADVASYPRPGMDAPGMVGFTPDSSAVTWLHAADGGLVRSLWRIDVKTGERTVIAGPAQTLQCPARKNCCVSARGLASSSRILLVGPRIRGAGADDPGPTVRVSVDGEALRELPDSEGALTPTLSPDGTQLSFVRGGELFALAVDGSSKARQLTTGAEDGLTHGLADYIAQEEFGQLRGHWWSTDGRIAYLRVDERHVAPYPIVHQGGNDVDVETHRYPFAGVTRTHACRCGLLTLRRTKCTVSFLSLEERWLSRPCGLVVGRRHRAAISGSMGRPSTEATAADRI